VSLDTMLWVFVQNVLATSGELSKMLSNLQTIRRTTCRRMNRSYKNTLRTERYRSSQVLLSGNFQQLPE